MFKNKKNLIYLFLILITAFFLRILGIWFGLPGFTFQADENFIISNLLQMKATGALSPDNVVYPTLIYYLLWFISFLFHNEGKNYLLIMGRGIALITGTLSVYLIYLICKEVFNKKIALISSFLLAVNFLHLVNSQYLKVDVPGTFFGLLVFLFALKIFKQGKSIYYILGGISLGLAFGTQYSQIFFLVPLLLAHFFHLKKKTESRKFFSLLNKNFVFFILIFLISSFIVNPYFYLRFNNFLSTVTLFKQNASAGIPMLSDHNINTPAWYFLYFLTSGVYYPIFLTTLMGAFLLFKRRDKTSFLLLSYPAVHLIYIILNNYRIDRLAIPLMPFFAIYSALSIDYLKSVFDKYKINMAIKKILFVFVIVLFFGFPLLRSSLFSFTTAKKDTRELAARYIETKYPNNQVIFAAGDTIHIGQYLQSKGFYNVVNLFPLESQEVFLYPGEIILVDSSNYHAAENYRDVENYKNFWENYQLIRQKGKLVKDFSRLFFASGLFSPAFLEHSSTVNTYHNPTVQIFEIPKILGKEIPFKRQYFAKDMTKSSTIELVSDKDATKGQALLISYPKMGTIIGSYEAVPKGKYKITYRLKVGDNRTNDNVAFLGITNVGGDKMIVQRMIQEKIFPKPDQYYDFEFSFFLEKAIRLEIDVLYQGKNKLWVDNIKIERLGDD